MKTKAKVVMLSFNNDVHMMSSNYTGNLNDWLSCQQDEVLSVQICPRENGRYDVFVTLKMPK